MPLKRPKPQEENLLKPNPLLGELENLDIEIKRKKETLVDLNIIKEQVEEEKKRLSDLKNGTLATEVKEITTKIEGLKNLEEKATLVVESKEAKLNILKNEIEQADDYLQLLKQETLVLLKEKSSLEVTISEKKSESEGLGKKVETLKEYELKLKVVEKDLKSSELVYEKLLKDISQVNKEILDKKQGIEDREGKISKDEARLSEGILKLKVLKQELEAYYNRKFPYITI